MLNSMVIVAKTPNEIEKSYVWLAFLYTSSATTNYVKCVRLFDFLIEPNRKSDEANDWANSLHVSHRFLSKRVEIG